MRFYLVSLGCPKNTVESEGMGALLRAAGHEPTPAPQDADLLIVNTCGFIDIAREESLEELRELAASKRPDQYLVAAGCLAERSGQGIADMVPHLDAIIGTRRWRDIVTLTDTLISHEEAHAPCELLGSASHRSLVHPLPRSCSGLATAYVKIAEGCDGPCAFCVIPQIKGPFQSKPGEAVVTEVRELVRQGVKEVILIAQDTTAYGIDRGEKDALPSLIETVLAAAPDLDWLRIMYTYPQRITPQLIQTMASHPRVLHYLDMPLQHAHPEALRRMNRPHDIGYVRSLLVDLRQAMPDIALRTSVIVGYPGETEDEFQSLLGFLTEESFDRVGVFTYSQEEGTPAAQLPGQVSKEIKQERLERIMTKQQSISLRKNRQLVGSALKVLVEGAGDGISVGRSYRDAPEVDGTVIVWGELSVNEFASVRVTQALEYDLIAEPE